VCTACVRVIAREGGYGGGSANGTSPQACAIRHALFALASEWGGGASMANGARMAKRRTKRPPAHLTPHPLAHYPARQPRRAPNHEVLRVARKQALKDRPTPEP